MTQLFISDLHLHESRPDLTHAFLHFLEHDAVQAETLYILGDFFDVWLGDDHDTRFNRQVMDALANLSVKKFLMHGNRDFLIGEEFCRATGAELLDDPCVVDLYGRPALLMHGDSLCTRDEEYMAVRQVLRDGNFQREFLQKSIDERAAFATDARGKSKEHTRDTADDIMDVTPSEVAKTMQHHQVDLLIHGHTHRPDVHKISLGDGTPATRIVLGDWDSRGWVLRVSPHELALEDFRIES
ncbi:MAG: UDP-2,3-diacylglucosamine diphosphatase [Pseudomonadales bacterium]